MVDVHVNSSSAKNDTIEILDLSWNKIRVPGAIAISFGLSVSHDIIIDLQECIPVECLTSAAVAVSPAMHAPCHGCPLLAMHATCHACPLPCMPTCHTCPLPCMPPCHTCPLPHMPLPHMPPVIHAPCYACPLSCMPPVTHAPSPTMHAPCHAYPLPHIPLPTVDRILDTHL